MTYTYNAAQVLTLVVDNGGNQIDYVHDGWGNVTSETTKDQGGAITQTLTRVYDTMNHLDSINHGGSVTDLTFNAAGNLMAERDPNYPQTSLETTHSYDTRNRRTQSTNSFGTTSYNYDLADNLQDVTAPNAAFTDYDYDGLGNLIKESSPDRGEALYDHDEAGNITCKADGRYTQGQSYADCASVPERWVYTYDALNRVSTIDYLSTSAPATPDVSYSYDGTGELGRLDIISQEHATGEIVDTQFNYDLFGNVTKKTQFIPNSPAPAGYVTQYQYDGNDQVTQITYPSGRVVDYVRNAVGRIRQITSTSPVAPYAVTTLVNNVNYKPFGPPATISFANGLFSSRTYDSAYRVADVGLSTASYPVTVVDYHTYALDPAGNITKDTDLLNAANIRDYEYDALHRLIDDTHVEQDPDPLVKTYEYDANGNRTKRNATEAGFSTDTIVYNAASNRVSTFNGSTVSYDGAGNRIDILSYNAANRLSQITNGGDKLTTLPNGLGELAQTHEVPFCQCGGCANWKRYYHFASDGRALGTVQRTDSNITIERDWIWLDGIPIVQIQESYDTAGVHQGTQTTYLHADHLGTPRMGTDAIGTVTWVYGSDAFGKAAVYGPDTVIPLRMPGQVDYEFGGMGIYYNYFRDYDSNTGRYLESDPIGLQGGLNTYAYVGSNPLFFGAGEFLSATVQGSCAWHFLGSFAINVYPISCSKVRIVVTNNSSFTSFTYGVGPSWNSGPAGNLNQRYEWEESL